MTAAAARRRLLALPALLLLASASTLYAEAPRHRLGVSWLPAHPRAGDVVLFRVRGVPDGAVVDAMVDGHPVGLFPSADGHAGVVGIDMDSAPGPRRWQVMARKGSAVDVANGDLPVAGRVYRIQRLTVARAMSELDPATERRAEISGQLQWRSTR